MCHFALRSVHSILAMARGRRGQIALACAATGIAAELLPLGDTVHKRFGVPLQVDHTVWAGFNKPHTQLYQCVMQAKMIVIDEVFSLSYDVLACVERTLREAHNSRAPWGGVAVILSGDPRQCAPVVDGGDPQDVIRKSIVGKDILRPFQRFELTENLRLRQEGLSFEQIVTTRLLATMCWLSEATTFPNCPTLTIL